MPRSLLTNWADTHHHSPPKRPPLLDRDVAWLNTLRFRKRQSQHALIDASGDQGRIDRRIQFVAPPEIGLADLAIDRLARKFLHLPVTDNRQFTIVYRQFETGFIDTGDFHVNRVTLF